MQTVRHVWKYKVAFSDQFQVEQGTGYSAVTACNLVTSSGVKLVLHTTSVHKDIQERMYTQMFKNRDSY